MNKKLYILLGVSLALNFALGGYVIGKVSNPVPQQRPHFVRMMPKGKDHNLFKQAFVQNAKEMKEVHKAVVEAFKSGEETKIREALKVAGEVRRKMDEQIQNKMIEDFMKMSDEEKANFLKKFDRKGMKTHHCHKKFKGKRHHKHEYIKKMPVVNEAKEALPESNAQ
ncbi:MAG: hypothetical protein MJ247_01245 [Alphaproteobacteria bacterium]|nr:hypothetical protein [Alphaproteobacteria bacterium]